MKRYPRDQIPIQHRDTSDSEDAESAPSQPAGASAVRSPVTDSATRNKQAKSGSIGNKLLGLVAGTSAGK
jgi:hypothetical protein